MSQAKAATRETPAPSPEQPACKQPGSEGQALLLHVLLQLPDGTSAQETVQREVRAASCMRFLCLHAAPDACLLAQVALKSPFIQQQVEQHDCGLAEKPVVLPIAVRSHAAVA